ncbi:efflux RND transporter permease subunit [Rhabdochromatium marinum]|uniref:efflux RND transporter permease subunit n=1 Tax=Rhabdochromatium marinum TaxID=48729 RepID=UPI0019085AAD|nr:acriflavine resistance protein B [Rhabdochromatium marinum]
MNITVWAFRHRPVVALILVALMGYGVISYFALPAREDPQITVREAVITTEFAGLSAERVERQITRPLEDAVRRVPEVEEIRSLSMPGRSIIHAKLYPTLFDLDAIWQDLRNRIAVVEPSLPEGTRPPQVNTDFGDVAVATVALMGKDFTWQERTNQAEAIRDRLYGVPGTKRIDVLGAQPECIYVDFRNARLAELGLDANAIARQLHAENSFHPGGQIDTGTRQLLLEPSGAFADVAAVRERLIQLPGGGGTLPLGELAEVHRGPVDPPQRPAYFNGQPAIVLAISMREGWSVLDYGRALSAMLDDIKTTVPVGYTLATMTFQAEQVAKAVYGVSANVLQTLMVVLVVVIAFLGLRTGLIVGAIVPAVILVTLAIMGFFNIDLQRMSLATLVIALGLLVDNAIVVADDYKRRLEIGESRVAALRGVGRELSIPLLISTLTSILVFLPLMLAEHTAGEYTRSISQVILIALLSSWVLAMLVTPSLCHRFAPTPTANTDAQSPRLADRAFQWLADQYGRLLRVLLRHPRVLLALMVALMVAAVAGMSQVPQRFFPNSDRAQLLVEIDLPAGVSTRATDAAIRKIFAALKPAGTAAALGERIHSHATYIGFGGPRFVLSLTPIDAAPNKAFMVINLVEFGQMDALMEELRVLFQEVTPELNARVSKMFLGPSDSSKLSIQVKGPDPAVLDAVGDRIQAALYQIPGTLDVHRDWANRIPQLEVVIDPARATRAGLSNHAIAETLARAFTGQTATLLREDDEQIPIVLRADDQERAQAERIQTLSLAAPETGRPIPLMQVADVRLVNAYGRLAREDLELTLTVEARNLGLNAEDLAPRIAPALDALARELPPSHRIEFDGVVVDSGEARAALMANLPLCLVVMLILLVAQFNDYRRPAIIVLSIPLLLIGAVLGLLLMGASFGFMVILGLYALAGILMNNAIVLIDRIDSERRSGLPLVQAIVSASTCRLRPILMATITTALGLAPLILARDPLFYGMASVMAFGLLVGTVLTLGVVPVLYSLLFRTQGAAQPV